MATKQKLVLHMLTAMPPHNVNRDEDGRPKTAMLGDTLRARISSQAKKRALRYAGHLPDGQRAIRTRELAIKVFRDLTKPGEGTLDETSAAWIALAVNHAIGAGGKAPDRAEAEVVLTPKKAADQTTDAKRRAALAKLAKERAERVAKIVDEMQMDEAAATRRAIEEALGTEQGLVVSTHEVAAADALVARLRAAPAGQKGEVVEAEVAALKQHGLLDQTSRDLDLALFGRMVAAQPRYNIEAAASVGHAITTHSFSIEADYFSAGEELNALEGTGAAITSYGFYGSGVYYQHAVLDYDHLLENLNGDRALAQQAVELFLHGLVHAQPKGKRNAFASDTAAIFVIARRTASASVNLGFAFLEPVKGADVAKESIKRLREFDATIAEAYAIDGDACVFNAYPPARDPNSNIPPAGEVWTYAALSAFAVGGVT
jgi:CRISPR system Cascade subunit CasC